MDTKTRWQRWLAGALAATCILAGLAPSWGASSPDAQAHSAAYVAHIGTAAMRPSDYFPRGR